MGNKFCNEKFIFQIQVKFSIKIYSPENANKNYFFNTKMGNKNIFNTTLFCWKIFNPILELDS